MEKPFSNKYFYIAVFTAIVLVVVTGIFLLVYGKNDSFQLINSNHNTFFDFFFQYYTHAGDGLMWLPFALYCIFFRREYLLAVTVGFIISTVLTHFLKRVVYPDELRPFTSLSVEFPIHIIEGVKMRRVNSFPSGHTGTAFSIALVLSLVINKKSWAIILPILALLVAYSRVYLGQHYVTDVLAGMVVGIVAAVLSVLIYQKYNHRMKKSFPGYFMVLSFLLLSSFQSGAQSKIDSLFPIRGFAIAAPSPQLLDSFIVFIDQELAPRMVNTLVLRIDFNYQYKTHPELVENSALSEAEVKKILNACRRNNIRIIPQINLLGHQSWAGQVGKLLAAYPQFDETPHVKMPEKYSWPNADSLYCKSYCPLHPDVHKVVFALVDEICDVFETDAFHAGMDEVFYIGDDKCPRCSGKNKAELFAGEVKKIRDHLALQKRELWIWGDRLLDGRVTGLGMWEASFNNTDFAIDMIPKDIVICDWHYERPDKTAVYFAMKGFRVVTCSWRNPLVAVAQVNDMFSFRQQSTTQMKDRFYGVMETIWSGVGSFFNGFYGKKLKEKQPDNNTPENCFRAMFEQIKILAKPD